MENKLHKKNGLILLSSLRNKCFKSEKISYTCKQSKEKNSHSLSTFFYQDFQSKFFEITFIYKLLINLFSSFINILCSYVYSIKLRSYHQSKELDIFLK